MLQIYKAATTPATTAAAAAKPPIPLMSAAAFPVWDALVALAPDPPAVAVAVVNPKLDAAAAPVTEVTIVDVHEQSEL
jgi:hypothetical protein